MKMRWLFENSTDDFSVFGDYQARVKGKNLTGKDSLIIFNKLRGYNTEEIIRNVEKSSKGGITVTQDDVENALQNEYKKIENIDFSGIKKTSTPSPDKNSDEAESESEEKGILHDLDAKKLRAYTDKLTNDQFDFLIDTLEKRIYKLEAAKRGLDIADKFKDKKYAQKHRNKILGNISNT